MAVSVAHMPDEPIIRNPHEGLRAYYTSKIEEMQITIRDKTNNLERLKAQRNELNTRVRLMREELMQLHEPGSHVGEVVKAMGKTKVLVKADGKYVVDLDKDIDINKCTPNTRVALRSDSYTLHKILPTKVDPLVSLMKVEKVPDSTYDMVGGLSKQIQEIKEVIELPIKHPELFEALGVAQPKGVLVRFSFFFLFIFATMLIFLFLRNASCMVHLAQEKLFSHVLLRTTQIARLFVFLAQNWSKSTLERDREWSESCSSWRERRLRRSYSWTR